MLERYAALAEKYLFDDPNTALIKLRQFAEVLARLACANVGVSTSPADELTRVLALLRDNRAATGDTLDLFHAIRRAGNAAAHDGIGTRGDALHHLRMARQLAVWFDRSFGRRSQSYGPFIPPPNPTDATAALTAELDRLRNEALEQRAEAEKLKLSAAAAAEARRIAASEAERAYADLNAALALAADSETARERERQGFEQQLAAVQTAAAQKPNEEVEKVLERVRASAALVEMDEAATRRRIDQQLRDAGWEADSDTLRHSLGVSPQKGRNLAIAEWPTAQGPADYVLFLGLTPVAAVEAKKANEDVSGKLEQAKRYSRGFQAEPPAIDTGGPWGEQHLPFCFSTNGRGYLRQLETKSGVWFCDVRRPTNLSRALESWYTPTGLQELLRSDEAAAQAKLTAEPTDYLPLRDYQLDAVRRVEAEITAGKRAMLVAMATGTGKTITCLGLIYRLLKAGRFRRILFLVDRSSLEQQAFERFEEAKLEGLRPITQIYDVKRLDELTPDPDTRLHFGTIQGMVRRILYADDPTTIPPVDAYDCVIVDECHRGYTADRELSDAELTFRDEADYVSKYRRVLDHFDAVKVGLTATPAQHTVEIFGPPVYQYSYRQAVLDGWLVDHEPPLQILTKLTKDGICWDRNERVEYIVPAKDPAEVHSEITPDTIELEIDDFHRRVITENYNRVVCDVLAEQIDPSHPGKTIIFCVNDAHADLVVSLLKKAFAARYEQIEDDAVMKITGKSDKPLKLIKRFQNERLPSVAVTVDLLTTGTDVPAVANIVFLRRVRSRILYEQMLGRGTRLCPEIEKTVFRVFDAVKLYAALLPHSKMRPIVTRLNLPFTQLDAELRTLTEPKARAEVHDQFLAKLRAKRRVLESNEVNAESCRRLTGRTPAELVAHFAHLTPDQAGDYLQANPKLSEFLDLARLEPGKVYLSDHPDQLVSAEHGYGEGQQRPADYLESFREFVTANRDKLAALSLVATRPRDLTRQALKELRAALHEAGFTETHLQTAWRDTRNEDIVATLIGHVRHVMTGEPLLPYKERVAAAMKKVLASRPWKPPQRKWLERIGKQLETDTVVDRQAFDQGQFQAEGGFTRLNKVFDGELETILGQIVDAIWPTAA